MRQPDLSSWINNMRQKGVEMPEFVEKPAFPLIAESGVGTMVTLEGVTIKNLLPLKQTGGGPLQGFFATDGTHEGFVKVWRPERELLAGQVVTVVGRVTEYQGKRSVEVDAAKGGGIASEGEPLATIPASAPPTTRVQQPKPGVEKRSFLFYYSRAAKAMRKVWVEERNQCASTQSLMIAYHHGEISEEELARFLDDPLDDGVPF